MTIKRLLVANRGEIAIRIARAAAELGCETVAVYTQDDGSSLHVTQAGYRNELAAIEDPAERRARFAEMVERAYQHGKALNYASLFGIDDTIDPADSRRWVSGLLGSLRREPRRGKKRAAIDAW